MNAVRLFLVMFALFAFAHAAPAPPQVIVNNATMQCADYSAGDECTSCEIPQGWASLGYGNPECPSGYSRITVSLECHPSQSGFCCSEGHSGGNGNCTNMVVSSQRNECAFVTNPPSAQQCILPTEWQKEPSAGDWLCPGGYSWANVSCGMHETGNLPESFCPIAFVFPMLGLALLVFKK